MVSRTTSHARGLSAVTAQSLLTTLCGLTTWYAYGH